jgi:hypothetical protein
MTPLMSASASPAAMSRSNAASAPTSLSARIAKPSALICRRPSTLTCARHSRPPDPNIDHRRVPNLQTFFARKGAEQPRPSSAIGWQAGDLVTQMIPGGRPHIGIVSAQKNPSDDRPLIIHNIGRGTQIEDVLDLFPVTGRYVFFPAG